MKRKTYVEESGEICDSLAQILGVKPTNIEITPINGKMRVRFSETMRRRYPNLACELTGTPRELVDLAQRLVEASKSHICCQKAKKIVAQALGVNSSNIDVKPAGDGQITARFDKTVIHKNRGIPLPRTFNGTMEGLFALVGLDEGQLRRVYA